MKLGDVLAGIFLVIAAVILSIPIATGARSLGVPIIP